jgi:hypothetical protein
MPEKRVSLRSSLLGLSIIVSMPSSHHLFDTSHATPESRPGVGQIPSLLNAHYQVLAPRTSQRKCPN